MISNQLKRISVFLIVLFLISSCVGLSNKAAESTITPVNLQPTHTPTIQELEEVDWWKTAVFYQVFVRSFYDSDGDGIGDFRGMIQKLDYLNDGNPQTENDLAIDALWLMPIHPSSSYHGYDVTDYYQVNPDYGTLEDFKDLIDAAHQRGIRVIIDLVINHTSTQHPWFQQALDPQSPFHDYYIWQDEKPGYTGPEGQKVWHRAANGQYYYALFWDQMPDLNLENPVVTQEIYQIARFWLEEVGVDGFRIDAAKHLIEEGADQENTDSTHQWFADFYRYYKSINPQAITVGEVWSNSFEAVRYLRNQEMDVVFNFDLARSILSNVNNRNAASLSNTLTFETRLFPPGGMGIFLSNHDQDRVMTVLMQDENKARIAAAIYLTSPGVPFIYYGEEIGLTGQGDHRNIRTPMQWSADSKAGFTSGTPRLFPKPDYAEKNVQNQLQDSNSLLRYYIDLLRIRSQSEGLQSGRFHPVTSSSTAILSYVRVSQDEQVLMILNLSNQPQEKVTFRTLEGLLPGRYRLQPLRGKIVEVDVLVEQDGSLRDFEFPDIIPVGDVLIYKLEKLPEN